MSDRGPYRVSTCAADCSGAAHSDMCPADVAYWEAHAKDRRAATIAATSPPDDASIRFSLMELD